MKRRPCLVLLSTPANPKPPLTPFVNIPSLISLVFDKYPLGTSIGTELGLEPSCPANLRSIALPQRYLSQNLFMVSHFIPTFNEIANVEQQFAFRCFIGREQCEPAFVIQFFLPAANKSTVKLALNQLGPDTSPQISVSTHNSCWTHFWMSHSWWQFRGKSVSFLTSCQPVRMRWSDLLCGQSPSLTPATEVSP